VFADCLRFSDIGSHYNTGDEPAIGRLSPPTRENIGAARTYSMCTGVAFHKKSPNSGSHSRPVLVYGAANNTGDAEPVSAVSRTAEQICGVPLSGTYNKRALTAA
jgi:hypothetical protein